ncbi:MAG TPA: hypothetical protein VMU07_01270 [Candidatus Paceibacterota bacterium]|nr:hypothetical protein [Candidatus Paceibacterota bacterium]
MEKIEIKNHCAVGILWFIGWLFTIGYLHLSFWKGVLAIIIWPFYIGAHFAA